MAEGVESLVEVANARSVFLHRKAYERILVGVTCMLSMAGSVCVVVSYVCFRRFRSQARQILVHLSLADFAIGVVNLVGVAVDFERYYYNLTAEGYVPLEASRVVDDVCKAQAFLGLAAALSSVMWTACLAVYMYLLLLQSQQRNVAYQYYLLGGYVVCYGAPLLLSLWLLCTGRLGHAPYNASGWCGVVAVRRVGAMFVVDYMGVVFGWDLWVYLAFVVCVTAYTALFLQLNVQFSAAIELVGSKRYWKSALEFLDYRLILIPVVFILLRVWTCIINLLFIYVGIDPTQFSPRMSRALILLAGIGDSGQGFVNGLLFVLFTGAVRSKFLSVDIDSSLSKAGQQRHLAPYSVNAGETTPLIPSRSKQGQTNEWGKSTTPTESYDAECSA